MATLKSVFLIDFQSTSDISNEKILNLHLMSCFNIHFQSELGKIIRVLSEFKCKLSIH